MKSIIYAPIIFLILTNPANSMRLQGVAVRGKLTCGDKPWPNAKIKLYDIDTNPGDPDDLLDEKYSDKNGEFRVDGTTRELTPIDPVLYIYHDCEDGIKPCQKKITLTIPKKFIHFGTATAWMDIGVLNLEMEFPEQDRSCYH